MVRKNRFTILLTANERSVIERLAQAEKLAPSTFARRRLLFEAEQRGIVPLPEKHEDTGCEFADLPGVFTK